MKVISNFTQEKTLTEIMYPGMFLKNFVIHPTEMLVFLSYNYSDKPLQVVLHIHCYRL